MLKSSCRGLVMASILLTLYGGGAAAGGSPIGVWIDHSGEGAVEITDCGGKLCGKVVWLKSTVNLDTCNVEIIGNVKASAKGSWGGGWIYDPDSKSKYDVEITPMGGDRLKVFGYAGSKLFGETMTWTRAPDDLKRCGTTQEAKVEPVVPPMQPVPDKQAQTAAVEPVPARGSNAQTGATPNPSSRAATQSVAVPDQAQSAPQVSPPPSVPQPGGVAVTPAKPIQEKPRTKVAAKKSFFDELDLDDVKISNNKGKCSVAIKEVGTFKFDCD